MRRAKTNTINLAIDKKEPEFKKKELTFCWLDRGERHWTYTTDNVKVFYYDEELVEGDLVSLTKDSKIDGWVAKKAKKNDIAVGYVIIKGSPDLHEKYERAGILIVGQMFRLRIDKLTSGNYGWEVNQKVLINENGLSADKGQDIGFLATHNVESGSKNDYAIVVRNPSGYHLTPSIQTCVDLSDLTFRQEQGVLIMDVPTGNIMEQSEITKRNYGNTYLKVPDLAIINTIKFKRDNYTDEILKNWLGCDY